MQEPASCKAWKRPAKGELDLLRGTVIKGPDYCKVCCYEEELEAIKHLPCNYPALSKLRLKTLGKGFFKALNSMSRANIEPVYNFIISLCLFT